MLDLKRKWAERDYDEPASGNIVWKVVNIILTVLVVLIGTLTVLAYRSYHWASNTWSELSMNEIVYHMNTTVEGASDMIGQYIRSCVIITVVFMILLIVAFVLLRRKRLFYHLLQAVVVIASAIVLITTFNKFDEEVGVTEYMEAQDTYSSFIDDNYVDPNDVTLTFPEEKRNLVYIFLESMENTYSDQSNGGGFQENCIPELTQLSLDNENFSGSEGGLNGGIPLKGATWTIGAMFAQTCGLPLNIPIDKNAMSTQEEFFPGVTALGDILEDNGYKQTLLIGSDAAFGGRDLYFKGHGNYTIKDYYSAIEEGKIDSDYYVWWGYEDNRLFENAKEEMTKLASGTEPFNFTMLTVDTHFEDGYVCNDCPNTSDTQYANVMSCSSSKVKELIDWIQQQSWYENTTIVISGDHLTMDKDFCDNVAEDYQRTVYTTILNSPVERETDDKRTICTFDNFPTTLAALGVEIEGDRLGLGTNLYSAEPTLLERYTKDEANDGLQQQSKLMDDLLAGINTKLADVTVSDYNQVTKTITVDVSKVEYDVPLRAMYVATWAKSDQSDLQWYKMNDNGDGSYHFEIPLTEFNRNGKYKIHVYVDTDDPSITKVNVYQTSVKVEDPSFTESVQEEVVTETSGIVLVEGYNKDSKVINVYAVDVQTPNGVMNLQCAVWSKDDQSDLRWIGATEVDPGIYLMQINANDFNNTDREIQIHVYVNDNQGESILLESESGFFTEEDAADGQTQAAEQTQAPEQATAQETQPVAEGGQ